MEPLLDSVPVRVLLIEDDEDDYVLIRDLMGEISVASYHLKWVTTYEAALEEIGHFQHDVCLLDHRLGPHNGLELLEEAKAMGSRMPVIFLTGRGWYQVDMEAMKGGAADYLVKDLITAPLLERVIRYTIERARAKEALQRAHDELEEKVKERTAELTTANAALERASEKIKLFAYSVSHDLKSPAISIYGLARRLYENYAPILDEKGKNYCHQILHASGQIRELVEKINTYISAKENSIRVEDLDMKEIFQVIKEEFSTQLRIRGISWSEPARVPVIKADRSCMIRALRNLIDNALKYGGDQLSEIRIALEETEGFHILAISDDGIGIREDHAKKIFDLFERDDSSRGIQGSGLGLAIVKEIAEQHKGEVLAQPGTGRGMTVSLSLSKNL